MKSSYPGHLLVGDLSRGTVSAEDIPADHVRSYLGGRGIGSRLLWERVPRNADPLGAENALLVMPGALTGTSAPCSGRTTILAKGPATGHFLKVSIGGHLGISLKMAGVDGVLVTGCAEVPVVLVIEAGSARLEPAGDVWGEGVARTTERLQEIYGKDAEVTCIGPAGERKVRFAAIMTSVYNAGARGGIGAVMGAKRLKAIVTLPGGHVNVANPAAYGERVQQARDLLYSDSVAPDLHRFGTARDVDLLNELKLLPSHNFQRSSMGGDASALSGRTWPQSGHLKRIVGCGGCIYCCHRFTRIDQGAYAGTASGGPEYETVAAFGSGCGVSDAEAVFAANALSNDLGMDTISTGNVIQWAMECVQRGVLGSEDFDGLDLRFGRGDAMVEMVRRIGTREGIGDLLAEGTLRASREVGCGSEKWAVQARGLEQSNVETRGSFSYALAFAVNPRGPDHLHTECLAEFGGTKEGIALVKRITGDERLAVPNIEDQRETIVTWHEKIYAVSDALGLCAFSTTAAYSLTEEILASLYEAATGVPMDAPQLMRAGERILTLERCFSLREGLIPKRDDRLPWRIMNEAQPDLADGDPMNRDLLGRMLGRYYELHGWDQDGWPTSRRLEELDLEFAAQLCDRIRRGAMEGET